jgi:hypothetical protein
MARRKSSEPAGDAVVEKADDDDAANEKAEKVEKAPAPSDKPAAADAVAEKKTLPAIEPPPAKTEPWPDATPAPMPPVEPMLDPPRTRTETMAMPSGGFGRPPEMPRTSALPPLALGQIENPTYMPGPRDIPSGDPGDPAPAPGRVPPGDSRSLRKDADFALVYRLATYVITRSGKLGTRGQWRVVEYPTSSAAGTAYAKECSRFVSDGFSDYRD